MQPIEGTAKTFNSGGDFGMEKLSKANKELKKLCGIKRLQLFSSKLTIPSTGSKSMTFTIPVNFAPYFEQE